MEIPEVPDDIEFDPDECEDGILVLYDARKRLRFTLNGAEEMLRLLMAIFITMGLRGGAEANSRMIRGLVDVEFIAEELVEIENNLVQHDLYSDVVCTYLNSLDALLPAFSERRNTSHAARQRARYEERGLHGMHEATEGGRATDTVEVDDGSCIGCSESMDLVQVTQNCRHDPVMCATCVSKVDGCCPVCRNTSE